MLTVAVVRAKIEHVEHSHAHSGSGMDRTMSGNYIPHCRYTAQSESGIRLLDVSDFSRDSCRLCTADMAW